MNLILVGQLAKEAKQEGRRSAPSVKGVQPDLTKEAGPYRWLRELLESRQLRKHVAPLDEWFQSLVKGRGGGAPGADFMFNAHPRQVMGQITDAARAARRTAKWQARGLAGGAAAGAGLGGYSLLAGDDDGGFMDDIDIDPNIAAAMPYLAGGTAGGIGGNLLARLANVRGGGRAGLTAGGALTGALLSNPRVREALLG